MTLQLLKKFQKISASKEGITRLGLTEWEDKAHSAAAAAFSRSRRVRQYRDQAGNSFIANGDSKGPFKGPYVVMGSHLDTVPNGGWLDGALGVAAGLWAMERILKKYRDARVAVAIWADEEGIRFGNGLWGSRVFAGSANPDELIRLKDRDGITLGELLAERGLQKKPRRSRETGELVPKIVYKAPIEVGVYAEAHIEQGRRLIDAGARVGLVTHVSGIRRWLLESVGEMNHAGTTPMRERRDALVPIAGLVGRLPQLVRGVENGVVTCGAMGVHPGVPNVIPDKVRAIVEHRAPTDRDQDEIARRLKELAATTGPRAPGVSLDMTSIAAVRPTRMSEEVTSRLEEVSQKVGAESIRMVSMAAHDAMAVARAVPAGLFFIPSLKGISHRADEDSRKEDIKLAGDILYYWALAELDRVL
jgi:allantoate deiminase